MERRREVADAEFLGDHCYAIDYSGVLRKCRCVAERGHIA
jgi:hypothetical protein